MDEAYDIKRDQRRDVWVDERAEDEETWLARANSWMFVYNIFNSSVI